MRLSITLLSLFGVLLTEISSTEFDSSPKPITDLRKRSDATLKFSSNGRCGKGSNWTCLRSNDGDCCSEYGYCGSTEAHCSTGCQPEYGTCWGEKSASKPATSQHSTAKPISSSVAVCTQASASVITVTASASTVTVSASTVTLSASTVTVSASTVTLSASTVTVSASTVTLSASTVTLSASTVTVSSTPTPGAVDQSGCPAIEGSSSFGYIIHCDSGAGAGSFAAVTSAGYNIEDCSSQCFDNPSNIDCLGVTYKPPTSPFNPLDGHLTAGFCTFYEFVTSAVASPGVVLGVYQNSFAN